ncbi:hypothetical protein HD554DRAFT_2026995, partial [Boletus coccyginus]
FWKRHCEAIKLIKPETKGTSKRLCKSQTCSRCQTIMYLGPEDSLVNHKKGYCSNGMKQISKVDEVPPWLQPCRIFTAGKTFHLQTFYMTI